MIRLYLLIFIVFLQSNTLYAQNSGAVSAPFPSRFHVEFDEGNIHLSWIPSSELSGELYRIYRFTEIINQNNISQATLIGETSENDTSFIDLPETPETYYYAVFAVSGNKEFQSFQPYRTISVNGVKITDDIIEEWNVSSIRQLSAESRGDEISILFYSEKADRNLGLFRSQTPFGGITTYENCILVRQFQSKEGLMEVTTQVFYGIPYYFSIADMALIDSYNPRIQNYSGSTSKPVTLPFSGLDTDGFRASTNRGIPLPRLESSYVIGIHPVLKNVNPLWSIIVPILPLRSMGSVPQPPLEVIPEQGRSVFLNYPQLEKELREKDFEAALIEIEKSIIMEDLSPEEKTWLGFYQSVCLSNMEQPRKAFLSMLQCPDLSGAIIDDWRRFIALQALSPLFYAY